MPDAEKILFGLDDIADLKSGVIVEGEPHKLACDARLVSAMPSRCLTARPDPAAE